MNISFSRPSIAAAIASMLLLVACGGGGGSTTGATGGTGSNNNGSTPTTVSINSANSKQVSAQVYSTSQSLNNQIISSSDLATGVSVSNVSGGLLDTALRQIYFALDHRPANLAVGVTTTETAACSGGGSATITVESDGTDDVSSGDRLTVTASNCVEGFVTIDGTMDVVFNSVTGTPSLNSAWSASMGVTFSNYRVIVNNVSSTATGDMTISYSQTNADNANLAGSGNSLQIRTVNGTAITDYTMSNYDYSATVTASNRYTYRTNFTINGSFPRIGTASYTVRTTTDFQQQRGTYPTAGAMTITASDNSSLTFTVVNATTVQLAVDQNGDGTMEDTVTTTWTELNTLL